MEDYSTFAQHLLASLEKREAEDNKPQPPSSLICFYGRPILPPLLSGEQREEMQGYRHAAQKASVHRKLKEDSRMAYVQTILHSVQLRKTPTLEELLQESEISPQHHNTIITASVSHAHPEDDPLLSTAPRRKAKDGVSLLPFTSTAYSAFLSTDVTPQLEGSLMDPHPSQHGSQPSPLNSVSHQSSGYATHKNVENTSLVSAGLDADMESHNVTTSEGAHSLGAFFLHTSNTIAKIPDIISYPPIDGEELERSGMESSFYDDFVCVQDICCSEPLEDSVICDSLQGEKSGSSEGSTESEASVFLATLLDPDKDQKPGRMEDQVSLSDNRSFSDNPESSQTLNVQQCPTTEPSIQQDPTETEQTDIRGDEEEPPGEPYRLSLQALLKKSQEYRRRQRMLRNQARNSKIQERTQEQPRVRAEEPSLSDKENDESPHKGSLSAEGKTAQEIRSTVIPSGQMSPKKSWDSERTAESELFGERTNCLIETLTEEEKIKERRGDDEELTLRNNKLNISQEVKTEPKKISAFVQRRPMSTEISSDQEEIRWKTNSTGFHKRERKYQTIPAPNFCTSPVRCKNKSSTQDEDAAERTGTSKVVINTGLDENQSSPRAVSSNVNLTDKDDLKGVSVRSSQHMDQLESDLSGLKVLISDLKSTLTENFRNQSPTESTLMQNDEEESKEADLDQRKLQKRQSSDTFMFEDTDDASVTEQESRSEAVNLSELRLVKTLVTERGKEKSSCKDGLSKSNGQGAFRKQHATAKCSLSAAQRQMIPDMFRNDASKAAAPPDSSMLLDTTNQPADKRNKADEERPNLSRSPSLNQSFDVDSPSGLWLLEGPGPDLGLKGCFVQGQQLTPESDVESQGGVSRVKRRLLMHTSEETPQKKTDVGGGAGSVVRPNSSSPKALLRWTDGYGSLKERQEQLREVHAAQIRALQNEHRRQQEELLQALAARFRLLQSVSFPCSVSGSRLGDTLTFTSLSQPSSTLSEHCRPLLLAVVKGFLTRRLLRTERVAQLVRTFRDTRLLLLALQLQSTRAGEFSSRQDLLLQERVALQLRAARYEVNNIFFSLSAREKMQLISWDRELTRERELRRQSGNTGHPRGKSSLSAATQKSLERKKGMMMQKKAAGRHIRGETKTGNNSESSPEQPLETKRGQFRANPRRVPRSTYSSRPR